MDSCPISLNATVSLTRGRPVRSSYTTHRRLAWPKYFAHVAVFEPLELVDKHRWISSCDVRAEILAGSKPGISFGVRFYSLRGLFLLQTFLMDEVPVSILSTDQQCAWRRPPDSIHAGWDVADPNSDPPVVGEGDDPRPEKPGGGYVF